ncbi:MAG: hypothetical protein FJ316_09650 [SAR202 cluster bacterium]|nr:hypothetical protein [SAR202 cluster bacterium]
MTRVGVLIWIVLAIALAFAWSRIFKRIGWSPWLAVTTVVPLVALVMPFLVAFSKWPSEDRPGRAQP